MKKPNQNELHELALGLAKLAGVPDQESGHFFNAVCDDVEDIWKQDWRAGEWKRTEALCKAHEAALTLNEAIGSLSEDDLRRLEGLLSQKPIFHLREHPPEEQRRELTAMVNEFASLFSVAIGKSGPSPVPGTDRLRNKAGRRPQTSNNPTFEMVIRHLRLWAKDTGGKFTFDKNYPDRGNLVRALDLLRPWLPTGVVPEPDDMSFATIQDIITKQNKSWET
jgi:hypothetical protein